MRVPAAAIIGWTGDDNDTDPTGLACDGNALYFFEGEQVSAPDPNTAGKALLRWDLATEQFSTHFTHALFRAHTGQPAANFTVLDLAADSAGIVYVLLSDNAQSPAVEYLVRVSNQGVGSALLMGSAADGTTAIAVDEPRGRLVALTATARGAPAGGLVSLDLGGSIPAVAYTPIVSEAALAAALTTAGTPEWSPSDLAVQPDGDVLIFNTGPNAPSGDLGSDGDCVRVSLGGAVSLFFDRALLDGLLGDPGTTGYGPAALGTDGAGDLLLMVFETDPGGATEVQEFFAHIDAEGGSAQLVAGEAQILADLGTGTDLSFTARGLALDPAGNALWSSNGVGIPQGLLMLAAPVPARLTLFDAE